MTNPSGFSPFKHKKRGRPISVQNTFFAIISVFLPILFLRNSELAVAYVGAGLRLCAATIIPALFPFLVLSELIVSGGVARKAGRLFAPIFAVCSA